MAQLVERILGKDEVISSILISSSNPMPNGMGFSFSEVNMTVRPLLKTSAVFVLAAFAAFRLNETARFVFCVLSAVSLLSFAVFYALKSKKTEIRLFPAAIISSVLLACCLSYFYCDVYCGNLLSDRCEIVCTVEEMTYCSDGFSSANVQITSVDGKKAYSGARLRYDGQLFAETGDIITFEGSISDIPETENGFPSGAYYKGKNIVFSAEPTGTIKTVGKSRSPVIVLKKFAEKLSARLEIMCGERSGGLASSILLGRKSELQDDISRNFGFLGISHILAVSGLHLTIIVGLADFILKKFLYGRPYILFAADAAIIVLFAMLTGLHASVIRAGIMMIILLSSRLFGYPSDSLTSLSFAAGCIVLFSPLAVFDFGFILSVSATLGLITSGRIMRDRITKKFGKGLRSSVLTALVQTGTALYFTFPAVVFCYGTVSFAAFLANLIFIPLATAVIIVSIAALLLFGTVFTPLCSAILNFICRITDTLSEKCALFFGAPAFVGYDFAFLCFIISLLAAFIILLTAKDGKKKNIIAAVTAPAVLVASMAVGITLNRFANPDTSVVQINIKSNDYLSVKENGKVLVIDISDGSYSNFSSAVSASLEKFGSSNADILLLSHLHSKHTVLVSRFCSDYLPEKIILPYGATDDEISVRESITALASEKGIEIITFDASEGQLFRLGETDVTIEKAQPVKGLSHSTICISFSSGGNSLRFVSKTADCINENDIILSHGGKSKNIFPECGIASTRSDAETFGLGKYLFDGGNIGIYVHQLTGR